MPKPIPHVDTFGESRLPEHGRIRLGEKTGRAMRSIDTFRFTSPDQAAIETIASLYGGVARPWDDPKASVRNQFEVKTDVASIPVIVPPGGLSVWYESWTAGGCDRRCDGETMFIRKGRESNDPCACDAANIMTCKPHTRLNVILTGIRFGGVWRLETKGWNAAHEISAMERMIFQLQDKMGPINARLVLEKRSKPGKNFVVPKLELDMDLAGLAAGQGNVVAIGGPGPVLVALPAPSKAQDDQVVDAEIMEEDEVRPAEWAEHIRAKYVNGNTRAETRMGIAQELVRRWPEFRSDEHCLDVLTMLASREEIDSYRDDLPEDVMTRLDKALDGLLVNEAEPVFHAGRIRLIRRQ